MFLQPRKFKHKKVKKGKLTKLDFRSNKLKFGTIGLKVTESGIINSRQLEACRQAISRKIKRRGKMWLRIFPDLPISTKPTESRMGKGKGSLSHWGSRVSSGRVIFELCGISDLKIALEALKSGGAKLPLKTKPFF